MSREVFKVKKKQNKTKQKQLRSEEANIEFECVHTNNNHFIQFLSFKSIINKYIYVMPKIKSQLFLALKISDKSQANYHHYIPIEILRSSVTKILLGFKSLKKTKEINKFI